MAYLHMLISLLISLLVSNAVTLRWDKSILFSRIVIIGLLFANFLALNNLFNKALVKGIGIYGGLFNVTTFTQSFNIFICLISAVILVLTAFSFTRIINIFKNILCKVFSFINNRVFNLMLSLLLFILLLLPFKLLLPLLNLSYLLPIISGFYACIFIIIISFIDDKKDLFNIIQLLYTFTIAVTLGYIALWCKQFELIYYLFAFMPLFAEIGTNEFSLRLSSSIALFMEGSDKGSDKNSPILSNSPFDFNTPSPTGTPVPPTFAQILWSSRYDSFDDAKRLDLAKRILLRKILDDMSARLGKNIPNEVQQCIQDNVWGNHWYDLYTKHDRFRKTRNTAIGTYFKSTWEK